jgi:hypothetical protein
MLAGVQPREVDQLEKTSLLRRIGRENIFVVRRSGWSIGVGGFGDGREVGGRATQEHEA